MTTEPDFPSPYKNMEQRYYNDVAFKQMVDMMVHHIRELRMSPGEMRSAAVFAEITFRSLCVNPPTIYRTADGETFFETDKYPWGGPIR